jgi:predicted dehydrogenase
MLRIGIVGSDNSHALAYSKLANVEKIAGDECQVVGIWGQEPERTREVAGEGKIESIVETPGALLDLVDAVMVVDRHGGLHAEHALPFIEAGLPVYVDKPFAISVEDCSRMLEAAGKSGAPVSSFSSLRIAPATVALADEAASIGEVRTAHFAGPCDFESEYGGPFFYATHVAEIALRLLGEGVQTLRAARRGKNVSVQLVWDDDRLVSFTYRGDAAYHFHATLFGTEGMASREVSTAGGYDETLKAFLRMVESGESPLSGEQMLRPIRLVHAIENSLKNGEDWTEVA